MAESARLSARVRGSEAGPEGAHSGVASRKMLMNWLPFAEAGATAPLCLIPGDFGSVEAEYAAIHRAAAFVDEPNKGVIVVSGAKRIDFLQRMLSNDLLPISSGNQSARAFLLNRKGRIEADLHLGQSPSARTPSGAQSGSVVVVVDLPRAATVAEQLSRYAVGDDVEVVDVSSSQSVISIHGPAAAATLARAELAMDSESLTATLATEQLGVAGVQCVMPRDRVSAWWSQLLRIAQPEGDQVRRLRPAGWYACNIARVEAGNPAFMIDFSTESLPHETGLLASRVSFTKGCYLGQEVVARMQSRGHPKQVVVALDILGDLLPAAGEQVFAADGIEVGVVTSSTLSPMLGGRPAALATVKYAHCAAGTKLRVNAEGSQVEVVVRAELAAIPRVPK